MNAHGWFNAFEAVFWIVIGTVVCIRSRKSERREKPVAIIASIAFVLFGVSDVVEICTGAWYEPAGLLALNAVCLTTLAGCYLWHRRIRARAARKP